MGFFATPKFSQNVPSLVTMLSTTFLHVTLYKRWYILKEGDLVLKTQWRDPWELWIFEDENGEICPFGSHNFSLQNMSLEGLLSWVLSLIFNYWRVSSAECLWLVESSQTIDQMASSSIRYYCHEVEQITRSTRHILLRL